MEWFEILLHILCQWMIYSRINGCLSGDESTTFPLLSDAMAAMGLGIKRQLRSSRASRDRDNVVIGIIDTGIERRSKTFTSSRMSPSPSYWNTNAPRVNDKIIVGRSYVRGETEVIDDDDGHGTNCAALAAGAMVKVTHGGFECQVVRGVVPDALLAIYRIPLSYDKYIGDAKDVILRAVSDGVKVLCIAFGRYNVRVVGECIKTDFLYDDVCQGSYRVAKKGVLTYLPAGNDSGEGTVMNEYPWALCVGASCSRQTYKTKVIISSVQDKRLNEVFVSEGYSINPYSIKGCPLINSRSASMEGHSRKLDPGKAIGKVVLYLPTDADLASDPGDVIGGRHAKRSNAAGLLIIRPTAGYSCYRVELANNNYT